MTGEGRLEQLLRKQLFAAHRTQGGELPAGMRAKLQVRAISSLLQGMLPLTFAC